MGRTSKVSSEPSSRQTWGNQQSGSNPIPPRWEISDRGRVDRVFLTRMVHYWRTSVERHTLKDAIMDSRNETTPDVLLKLTGR
ncbi:hypothetical protein MiSe_11760 [Microseira wollei NIES-4236]|uniref:Uncharacterized protein n=1 Tax=Microseira wollei NIES-4236 TaxID=2530354 RepID=A0AAV3X3Q8_9CYAN|nr:hypothetical protein MiSe_11760 [Microseira wollei NIES-4236]